MAWSRSQLLTILALIFTLLVNSQCHARSLQMEPKESDHLAMPKRVLGSKTALVSLGIEMYHSFSDLFGQIFGGKTQG
ncbi:hypothetical protein SLEP1_g5810 [Rubroshorea leprosula]|uniref:Uncharacterized protein n=1 Tax=Rubroshorea leprosula TaxID=152421 RepID=A0AAV5I275_9ROSI|nr:hypothetical protein SLEP1_g5810 [Rubroshorea leprosula]